MSQYQRTHSAPMLNDSRSPTRYTIKQKTHNKTRRDLKHKASPHLSPPLTRLEHTHPAPDRQTRTCPTQASPKRKSSECTRPLPSWSHCPCVTGSL